MGIEPRVRILGISGSLRRGSYNTRLLSAAARLLPPDVEFVHFTELKSIPPFDEDDEDDEPPAVAHLRNSIHSADGILIATPEYNHSLPGQLKNAVDWASRPVASAVLRNKSVAVIGASTGIFGAVWSQAETRKALAAAGARVLDRELAVGTAAYQLTDADELIEPELHTLLEEIVTTLLDEIRTTIELKLARST